MVFTTWTTADPLGDTDVALYLLSTQEVVPVVSRPSQQRFAEISETHIVFTDFSEDPDGHYDANSNDLADIGVYDRATHEITIRALAGKQAFPLLLAGGSLAYLHWDWVEVHPEPKLAAYHLRVGSLAPAVGSCRPRDGARHRGISALRPPRRPWGHAGVGRFPEWDLPLLEGENRQLVTARRREWTARWAALRARCHPELYGARHASHDRGSSVAHGGSAVASRRLCTARHPRRKVAFPRQWRRPPIDDQQRPRRNRMPNRCQFRTDR